MTESSNTKSQMRKGTLEYIVLLLLSKEKAYPSQIIKYFQQTDFEVVEGTVYTLLNRLRKEGKLNYEWRESREGPPRKYFYLTDTGKDALEGLVAEWRQISSTVSFFEKMEPLGNIQPK